MREITAGPARVCVSAGLLDRLADVVTVRAHRCVIITDTNVGPLYAARAMAALGALDPAVLSMLAGEQYKTRETWASLTDEMLAAGFSRDSLVVALGGGVVGDVAGFVAATYMRGVPCVQVPTSLVAMIDASIGGKTGVDVPAGKNLVGAFHHPAVVAADPSLLATLPQREFISGLAEAIKHGVIADAAYFGDVVSYARAHNGGASREPSETAALVERSILIKANVVADDPLESGKRKILNFGHTLGHALEAASGYTMLHGEAVAVGMALEARLGERLGVTAPGTADAIVDALRAARLPVTAEFEVDDIIARTHGDKKKSGGRVQYSLPAAIGRFEAWSTPVEDAVAREILRPA